MCLLNWMGAVGSGDIINHDEIEVELPKQDYKLNRPKFKKA